MFAAALEDCCAAVHMRYFAAAVDIAEPVAAVVVLAAGLAVDYRLAM